MRSVLLTKSAELLQFQLLLKIFRLVGIVINLLALLTLKFCVCFSFCHMFIFWSRWSDLNRRPTPYHGVALPLSYIGVVGREGELPEGFLRKGICAPLLLRI